jgi:hypothetical protein
MAVPREPPANPPAERFGPSLVRFQPAPAAFPIHPMKSSCFLLPCALLGLALAPALRAVNYLAADLQLERLENIVTLTAAQEKQALAIFQNLKDAIEGMTDAERLGARGMQARRDALAAIRAILTPDQQQVFDRTPQRLGGGSTAADPARQAVNARIRTFVRDYVRNSPEIAAQVGAFQRAQINLPGSSDSTFGDNPAPTAGTNIVRVTGAAGTKLFRIDWIVDGDGNMKVTLVKPQEG